MDRIQIPRKLQAVQESTTTVKPKKSESAHRKKVAVQSGSSRGMFLMSPSW